MTAPTKIRPYEHGQILDIYWLKSGEEIYPGDAADLSSSPVTLARPQSGGYRYEIIRSDGNNPERCVGISLSTVESSDLDRGVRIVDHGYVGAYASSTNTIEPQKYVKSAASGLIEEVTTANDILNMRGRTVWRAYSGKMTCVFLL